MLTFGSLFSGIGGLDLGLERAGMQCRWQSEIEPYCVKVLQKHWPHVQNLGDINGIEWERVEPVDVICGGYPCQPFSVAGARNGAEDARHLWPRFADAIRVLRPRYALLENVTGHLSLGFGDVLADLAACGYDTQWDCVPAAAVGAPHLRDRVFVIATRSDMADTDSVVMGQRRITQPDPTTCRSGRYNRSRETTDDLWQWWQTEPDVDRVADGIPARVDRLRALGNAVVPQVAQHVAQTIIEMERINNDGRFHDRRSTP